MADRYWVGGTGNWSDTNKWSTTSGGAGGASVPTSADNVIFDAGSDAGGIFTVTVDGTSGSPSLCQDFTAGSLDFALAFTMPASSYIAIYGSLTLPATNFTWTGTSTCNVEFKATTTGKTITTNGVTLNLGSGNSSVIIDGVGGEWTLGSALNITGRLDTYQGTFRTNNFNVTCTIWNFLNITSVKALYFGSSTITITSSAFGGGSNTTGTTVDAGTSTIIMQQNASPTFSGGGFTYYNVSFTGVGSGTAVVNGANTFNNLSVTSRSATGQKTIQFSANQTINGTLTLGEANTAIRRVWVASTVIGTPFTLTVTTMATLSDVDFRDITIAGTAAPVSGTRLGDSGGNSGITFAAPKTVYWNLAAGGNWSATAWATSSGGAVDVNNFPLAQDSAIIENTGLNTSATITLDQLWQLPGINFSTRSNAMTFATGSVIPIVYGDLIFSSSVTPTGTAAYSFVKRNATQIINTAGVTIPNGISYNGILGTLQLNSAVTTTGTTTLNSGTINLNGFDLTAAIFSSSFTTTRSIAFGTNKIVVTGNNAAVVNMSTATNFTYTGTSNVELNYSGSVGTRSITPGNTAGGTEANSLNIYVTAGTDTLSITALIKTLDLTGFSGTLGSATRTIYGNLVISSGTTITASTANTTLAATSGTQQITTNGKTIDFPLVQSGVNGTVQLVDNLTLAATRDYSLVNGTLNLNGKKLTCNTLSTSNSNVRSIAFAGGEIDCVSWTATTATNLTTTGSGMINMTSASAKTFAGGGASYPKLNQGGAGELIITGTNTFAEISNTVQPATITFPNVTTTIGKWSVKGTAGNLITLQRTGASGTFTLAYNGTSNVTSDYLSISNSTGSTANTWYAGANSVNGGGNTNWNFSYGNVRYWVGGTGNWDQSTTTNWAYLSGYAGGAPAPTANDDVYFDANSDAGAGFTVNILGVSATPSLCRDFTASGLDFTLALTMPASSYIAIYGSLTLPATNFTWTGVSASTVWFRATTSGKTITTNGVTFNLGAGNSSVLLDGAGGEWTLGSALNITGRLDTYQGTFRTNNFNVTSGAWNFLTVSTTRAIYLGSSVFTTSGSTLGNGTTTTGLTLDAGTSQINCTGATITFSGGGLTYYNVAFTSNVASGVNINGANTFNNLTFTSVGSTANRFVNIFANQTVNGTLTFGTANTAIRRMVVLSDGVGTSRTITVNGTVAAIADVDFRDITAAGTFGTWSGTRLGNAGGNTNITFDAGKNVYRVGTGNWSAGQWSLSSGGAVNVNNFPLAQDTAIFDTGTLTGTTTIEQPWSIGTLDMSQLDKAVTITTTTNANFFGDVILNANVTLNSGVWAFSGVATQTFTNSSAINTAAIVINKPTTQKFVFSDAYISTTTYAFGAIGLTQGIMDLNNNTVTAPSFTMSTTNLKSILFGTGKLALTGNAGSVIGMATMTGYSYTGSNRFECTYAGSTGTRTFDIGRAAGATEANVPDVYITAGTDIIDLRNNGMQFFRNLDFTGFAGSTSASQQLTIYGNLTYSSGMTVTSGNSLNLVKTTGAQQVTTNGKTIDFPVTQNGAGGTVRLMDALTIPSSRIYTLTAGTLDLNGFDLTAGIFSSSNSNVRSIAFGTNKVVLTGITGNIWATNVAGNFSYTGTPTVEATDTGSGNRNLYHGSSSGASEANTPSFYIKAGTGAVDVYAAKNLDYTGFSGSTVTASAKLIFGNVTFSTTMTIVASSTAWALAGTSGTQQITTNGKTLDFPVTQNGVGGTVQLVDNLTLGSTRAYTLTNGTLDLNEKKLTCSTFSTSNSNVRSIAFGTAGEIDCLTWTATTGTNLTTSGTGTINMTNASAKTFAGGGASYPTLNQGGLGTLSITGNNTFADMTNTVQPTTITFAAGSTTSVSDFNVSGTAGNLVTLNSSVPGTQWTIVKV